MTIVVLVLLLILAPFRADGAEVKPFTEADLFTHTPSMPLFEFISGWSGSFQGGDRAQGHGWVVVGAEYNRWGIGVLHQQQMDLRFAEDTARFYYLTENKLELEPAHRYDIDLDFRYAVMQGLRLHRRFEPGANLQAVVGVSLLQGLELLQGTLKGGVTPLSDRDYDFDDIHIDYHYSEDRLFDREVLAPQGEGMSLDLALNWNISHVLRAGVQARNLPGYLRWKNAPHTTALVTADNKEYDDDGYVTVHPALSGRHSSLDYRQRLLTVWRFDAAYRTTGRQDLLLEIYHTDAETLPSVGLGHRVDQQSAFRILFSPSTHAWTLGYHNTWLRLVYVTDSIDPGDARTLGLILNLQTTF